MVDSIFVLLALLFVKHWYIDFVDQTAEEVASKGIYASRAGINHSLKHGLATAVIVGLLLLDWEIAVAIGLLDFVLHYHIDWAKININAKYNYTVETPQFWAWLGADQLAHSLTYLGLVWIII
jgi:hypothetical protein